MFLISWIGFILINMSMAEMGSMYVTILRRHGHTGFQTLELFLDADMLSGPRRAEANTTGSRSLHQENIKSS